MVSSIFLATTAIENFWDTSKSIVFLSDACTRYSRKHFWQKSSQEILYNPILVRPRYYQEFAYAQSFYERMLPQIGVALNRIHGQEHSTRYWRMTVGFWLFTFIHVLYERYSAAKNALQKYPGLSTIVLDPQDFIVLRDTLDFATLSGEDAYNLQIYSRVFKFLGKDFPVKRYALSLPVDQPRTKNRLKQLGVDMGSLLLKASPVIARQPFIPQHKNKLRLILACRGKLAIDVSVDQRLKARPVDLAMRNALSGIKIEDHEFERFFLAVLSQEIPQIFMEGYSSFAQRSLEAYPFKPKAIWSATSWCWEETFKFWAAARSEEGTIIVCMQHGGNYGMDVIHPPEDHETSIGDKFYSWGWEKKATALINPMPVTKYLGAKALKANNQKTGVLFATVCMPRYTSRLHTFRSVDYQEYIHDQELFFSTLSPRLKALTRIRLFINDYGWDCRERWQDFDPSLNIEDWKTNFTQSMKNSRLHVSDHLSSTFIDAFAVGKPTILFWNQDIFKVRPEAQAYIDDLRQVGIFYDTPQAAAGAVDRIYDDVQGWWDEPKRQGIVKKFCQRYGRSSPLAFQEWADEVALLSKGIRTS